jgi:hypothetical protein
VSSVPCPYCGRFGHGQSYHDRRKRRVSWVVAAIIAVGLVGLAAERVWSARGEVSRSEFGSGWPLTVEAGTLACEDAGAVTFTSDGTTYAVNGPAQAMDRWPDIDAIWADAPGGFKKNIGPLVDRGLALCD